MNSLRSFDLSGTKAARANVYRLVGTVGNCFDAANVGLPSTVGLTMGVRHGVTENNALSADAAFCHIDTSLYARRAHQSFNEFS